MMDHRKMQDSTRAVVFMSNYDTIYHWYIKEFNKQSDEPIDPIILDKLAFVAATNLPEDVVLDSESYMLHAAIGKLTKVTDVEFYVDEYQKDNSKKLSKGEWALIGILLFLVALSFIFQLS